MSSEKGGRKQTQRSSLLVHSLRGRLSETVEAILMLMGVRRDPGFAVSVDDLRSLMQRRRWPVNEHLLEFERLVSGLDIGGGRHLAQNRWLLDVDEGAKVGAAWTKGLNFDLEAAGIYCIAARLKHTILVMPDGQIMFRRFEGLDEEIERREVLFDNFLQMLEVAVRTRDAMLWYFDGTDPLGWHRVWVDCPLGANLSAELGAEDLSSATGPTCSAWSGDGVHVVERRSAHFFNDTTILCADASGAFRAVKAVLDRHRHLRWIAPAGTVSEAMLEQFPRCQRGGGQGCKIFSWGQPTAYWPWDYEQHIRWPL